MTSWTVRRAEPADAAALAACIDAAYSVYAGRGLELPAVSDGVPEDIQANIVWVAVREREIIGGLVLIPRVDRAVLANIAVAPEATGLGVGRALMARAEAEARRLGLDRLSLTTHVDLPENLRLYAHLGWREARRAGSKVHLEKRLTDAGPAPRDNAQA